MAEFTVIPDANVEPDKPARALDGLALRDNPIAIAEGAAGAPRNQDASLSTTVTTAGTDWVLARNAGAAVGAVGTYALLHSVNDTAVVPGDTKAGSSLRYAGFRSRSTTTFSAADLEGSSSPTAPAGTWRAMGFDQSTISTRGATLWLRIS